MIMRQTLERLLDRTTRASRKRRSCWSALTDPTLAPAMGGAVLAALRAKGVTADEVRGFAKSMRKLARRPELSPGGPLVDMVGTGGDGSGSFNLSTGAALLVASMGIRVAKHGTSSVSSRSGSADVIRALGLGLPLDERASGECLGCDRLYVLLCASLPPGDESGDADPAGAGCTYCVQYSGPFVESRRTGLSFDRRVPRRYRAN